MASLAARAAADPKAVWVLNQPSDLPSAAAPANKKAGMTPILCKGLRVMEIGPRRYLVLVMDEADDAGRCAWYELTRARTQRSDAPVQDIAPSSPRKLAASSAT